MKRVAPFHYVAGRFVLLYHYFEPPTHEPRSFESHSCELGEVSEKSQHKSVPRPSSPALKTTRGQVDHWDLMFSTGESLLTYRLNHLPESDNARNKGWANIERLPDHRLHYLQYEGPISGNRGAVKRLAEGAFRRVDTAGESAVKKIIVEGETLQAELSIPPAEVGEQVLAQIHRWSLLTIR